MVWQCDKGTPLLQPATQNHIIFIDSDTKLLIRIVSMSVCVCSWVSLTSFPAYALVNPPPPPLLQISSLLLLFNGNEYDKNGLCWWQFRKRCSILDWRNSYTNSQHCWCFWWVEFKKDYLNLNIFIHKTENFERNILGNIICIWVLTKKKKELGLKPSFTNLLILLVSLVTSP